jgi:glycosyltransferase involved in cell wall biosynthesis
VPCASGPLISVIIPCYNHGQFLGEAIESALGQSYPHVEVLVVDDGSTDHSAQVAASYSGRIRSIRTENAGVSAARNTGILECRGEFVLCLDADDYLWPDMLEHHVETIRAHPTGTIFHGSSYDVDLSGHVTREGRARPLPAEPLHALLHHNPFSIHAVVVRRSAYASVGGFDLALRSSADWEMWIRLAAAGYEFVPVPNAVAVYRRYPGSLSTNVERIWRTGVALFRKSQAYHGECAQCRKAASDGLRNVRDACFGLLVSDLLACHADRAIGPGLRRAARTLVRNPVLTARLFDVSWRLLCRQPRRLARQLQIKWLQRS